MYYGLGHTPILISDTIRGGRWAKWDAATAVFSSQDVSSLLTEDICAALKTYGNSYTFFLELKKKKKVLSKGSIFLITSHRCTDLQRTFK